MSGENPFHSAEQNETKGIEKRLRSAETDAMVLVSVAERLMKKKSYWAESEGEVVLEKIKQNKDALEKLFDEWMADTSIEHSDEIAESVGRRIKDLLDIEKKIILEANFYKDK